MRMTGTIRRFCIFSIAIFCCTVVAQKPQKLTKKRFKVCDVPLELEIARSDSERNLGLMYRTAVPEGTGMVFVFEQLQPLSFWMKNVPMDIDIGYFDERGLLINFHTMKGTSPLLQDRSQPSYPSLRPARYAVEVVAGFYKSKNAKDCRLLPLPR